MRIDGLWYRCDDGAIRPILWGEVQTAHQAWLKAPFLVDTGADRTVFSADILCALALEPIRSPDRIGGVGGIAESVVVETEIRFSVECGGVAVFKGAFAGFSCGEMIDMSVLGRDILSLFCVIVDRQGDTVCLIRQGHSYVVTKG